MQHVFSFTIADAWAFLIYAAGAATAATKCDDLARTLELVSAGRYCSLPAANSEQVKCIGAVSNGDAVKFYAMAEAEGWVKAEKYVARYVG